MFIKKSTYNEMLDLINEQRQSIELLKHQNKMLTGTKDNLIKENSNLWATLYTKSDVVNINYPDTKGGNTANTGIDNINDILNL